MALMSQIITHRIQLAAKAHVQKKEFITKLLKIGKYGPLSMLTMELDGEPYYRLHKASFLIGMLGLNEMIQYHTGEQLHESKDAVMFGFKVMAHMNKEAERIGKEMGIKIPLEQTPAESTAYRMAKLDMKHYPMQAPTVIKGNKSAGELYYTNSTYLNVSTEMSPIERVKTEGKYHPLIEAGALSHVWLGESKPSPESLANFVTKTMRNTQNAQIAFSPEFTSCLDCGKTHRGLDEACHKCNSVNIEGITRVTGFFSKVSSWNKGKVGELQDRNRVEI